MRSFWPAWLTKSHRNLGIDRLDGWIAASQARTLGSVLLARAASANPGLRLDTYDRFFPNQDTMPKGGFGNLIALPLQKERRLHGFTEFVDEAFQPCPDQWAILASVRRIGTEELSTILEQCLEADISPDTPSLELEECILEQSGAKALDLPVLPDWQAFLTEKLIIPSEGLSDRMVARLKNLATFPNPIFCEKQRQRFPTYNIPRCIFSGELHSDRIVLPRGCLEQAVELFAECGSRLEIEDRRLRPKGISLSFNGNLYPNQSAAQRKMLEHEQGILVAPPGSGKTVMACSIIGKNKAPSLILVNRQVLLNQWLDALQEFLGLEKKEIGQWRGASKNAKGKVDIAMIQTLANVGDAQAFFRNYGMVVIDECHHVPALTPNQRQQRIDEFCLSVENGIPACLFATSSLLGEGFTEVHLANPMY